MNHIQYFILLLLLLAGCTSAPTPDVSTDTRAIDSLMDNWHLAAARADSVTFFGSMADASIYLGTDPGERWTKKEFIRFAMPYFRKGKAWDFHPYQRHITFISQGNVAWFDEMLSTWMGTCRGTGVLTKTRDAWKIEQYNLAVTVRNERIREFVNLQDTITP